MPVSIIGTRGSGKTTFISLLYQTMVYYTNDPKTEGQLKYYWRPEIGQKIQSEVNNMKNSGIYPPLSTTRKKLIYSFLLGFKPRKFEQLIKRAKEALVQRGDFKDFLCLALDLYDIAGEDLSKFNRNPDQFLYLKRMFDNNIMILTIDCSKFTMKTDTTKAEEQRNYDSHVSNILSSYIKYRSKRKLGDDSFNATLYPIIVLTQVDNLDGDIVTTHKLNTILKKSKDNEKEDKLINEVNLYQPHKAMTKLWDMANDVSIDVMRSHMPETLGILNGSELMNVNMGKKYTQYFLSWTANIRKGEVKLIKTTRLKYSSGKDYETNVYSRHMYVALLNYLREISEKEPDRDALINRMLDDVNWNEPKDKQ